MKIQPYSTDAVANEDGVVTHVSVVDAEGREFRRVELMRSWRMVSGKRHPWGVSISGYGDTAPDLARAYALHRTKR